MSLPIMIGIAIGAVVLVALTIYLVSRYYEARYERTYMVHDDRGFNRALRGRAVVWNPEESVVKGPTAPNVSFVAVDPATGGRRTVKLLDPRTGAINLRPHYCCPLPFEAVTADAHKVMVDAKVQFSLNRDLLKHVYEIDDFAQALEARIQSAFRSEIGKRQDEELRAALHDVERGAIDQLRRAEEEGDEEGEAGMALGARFHSASFSYSQPDEFAAAASGGVAAAIAMPPGATPEQQAAIRAAARAAGVLSMRPQQIDQLADVFRNRDPGSTAAILSLLDMQTRQNIAEALAASGQLIVVTPQELGLIGATAQRDAMLTRATRTESAPAAANGGMNRPESRA